MRTAIRLAAVGVAVASLPGAAAADATAATERARSGEFDATGAVRCAQGVGEPFGPCDAEVARDGASIAVVVTFPNGFARTLTFSKGEFLRGNATMSGVGTDSDWRLLDDTYHVRVDDQRFELSRTLVLGE